VPAGSPCPTGMCGEVGLWWLAGRNIGQSCVRSDVGEVLV
jgi:hypothetical protein